MAETNPAPPLPPRGAPSAGVVALLALGFLPLLLAYFAELWAQPAQRGYLLALPAAVLLGARGMRNLDQPATPGTAWLWLSLHILGLGLLVAATVMWSPGLGLLASLVALAGVVGWCGGARLLRALGPMFVLLLTLLAPLLPWNDRLWTALQEFVLKAVDRMLYTFEVPHLLGVNGFELTALTVPREELFAGLNGLPGLLVLLLGGLLWWRRHPLRILVVLAAVGVFAVPSEVLRVTWGLKACHATGGDFFQTARAGVITGALWLLWFGLGLSVDQFTGFLVEVRRRSGGPLPEAPAPAPRLPWRVALGLGRESSRLAWAFVAVALVLGLTATGRGWLRRNDLREAVGAASRLPAGAVFEMPAFGGEWRVLLASEVLGEVAMTARDVRTWQWQSGQVTLTLGLDGPLTGFVDPSPGYVKRGWQIAEASPVVSATNAVPPYVEVELTREPMLHGVLWFGLVDEAGRWLEPPNHGAGWVARPGATSPGSGASHRVQALAVSARPLTPAERAEARRVFDAARLALAAQLTRQVKQP